MTTLKIADFKIHALLADKGYLGIEHNGLHIHIDSNAGVTRVIIKDAEENLLQDFRWEVPITLPETPKIQPADVCGKHFSYRLPYHITPDQITQTLGFKPNVKDDPYKVTHSWGFLLDGQPCGIWDYYGNRWSVYDETGEVKKLFEHLIKPEGFKGLFEHLNKS